MSIWGAKPKRLKTNIETILEQGLERRLVVDVMGSFRHKMLIEYNDNELYTVKLFEPAGYNMKIIGENVTEDQVYIAMNYALGRNKKLTRD